jgi:hypothetical protein
MIENRYLVYIFQLSRRQIQGECPMKKTVCVLCGCVIVAALTLTGCPLTDPISGPSQDGPNSGSSSLKGRIIISGDLSTEEKLLTDTEMGDALKNKIEVFYISLSGVTHVYEDPFEILVNEDRTFEGELSVEPDSYNIWVEARDDSSHPDVNDGGGRTLFYDSIESFQVVSGETVTLDILMKFRSVYYFEFQLSNLPGEYPESGETVIVTDIEESYFTSYVNVEGVLHFGSWLPLNFDGSTSTMEVTNILGDTYVITPSFNLLDAMSGPIPLEYLGGAININIGFEYEAP